MGRVHGRAFFDSVNLCSKAIQTATGFYSVRYTPVFLHNLTTGTTSTIKLQSSLVRYHTIGHV